MKARIAILVLLGAALALVSGAAALPDRDEALPVEQAACAAAPPCGYIYPSILPKFTDMKDRLGPSELPSRGANLHLVFTWDMENEGTGLPDPLQEIKLSYGLAKKPQWLDVSFDPPEHAFLLNPAQNEYAFDTQVSFKVRPDVAVSEETGKRLMILIKSTESGTFKPSFGVEVVNFEFEGDPLSASPSSSDVELQNAPGHPLVVAVAAFATLAVWRRRR